MNGRNEIQMCQAEMVKAIEFYLREVVFKKEYADSVKVLAVRSRETLHFTVDLDGKDTAKENTANDA